MTCSRGFTICVAYFFTWSKTMLACGSDLISFMKHISADVTFGLETKTEDDFKHSNPCYTHHMSLCYMLRPSYFQMLFIKTTT